jgi:hypothetical protein
MFVYVDTNAEVTFTHPHPGPLSADIYRGAVKVGTRSGYPSVDGKFTVPLAWQETDKPGILRIEWFDNNTFRKNQYVEVVTPIAPLSYIESVLTENGSVSQNFNQQVKEMENTVRLIIEAYTGQNFSAVYGTKYAKGTVELSKVLSQSIQIDAISPPLTADLQQQFTYLNIKQAPPEGFTPGFDGVIRVPNDYYSNVRYTVTGLWGWLEVPAAVQEAALILIQELSCNESLYRDRYLQSVSYADNRFQFSPMAFAGTGNVKADQLLDSFKRGGMIIV